MKPLELTHAEALSRVAELEAVWNDQAALHATLLRLNYPVVLALHLAGAVDYHAVKTRVAELEAEIETVRQRAAGFGCWWAMVRAQEELAATPIPDGALILSFSGSGASATVHARDINAMLDAIYGTKEQDT